MRRYTDPHELPASPRIAVISNDAIGNYVVVTPMLKMLWLERRPSALDYFAGARTSELWSVDPKVSFGYALHGSPPRDAMSIASARGPYDLVINVEQGAWAKCFAAMLCGEHSFVCGPCLDHRGRADMAFPNDQRGRLWIDKEWIAPDLTRRYSFLQSGFIAEIFARLALLEGELAPYEVPSRPPARDIPPILIATSASLSDKLWPTEKWRAALRAIGAEAGLIGAKPSGRTSTWIGESIEEELVGTGLVRDLRGACTLPQVVGALSRARLVLTLDNGILHLAASTGTPIVGLFRHGIHRLWAPPVDSLRVLTPGEGKAVSEIDVVNVIEACLQSLGT